jgi:endonuclease YncB( thermonuclease family)
MEVFLQERQLILWDQFLGYLADAARWLLLTMLALVHSDEFSPWSGTVVQIVRPHEIMVRKNEQEVVNVRIYGIQCPLPDSRQFFAEDAMRYTSDRLRGRVVKVQPLPGRIEGTWYWPTIRAFDRLHWDANGGKYKRIIGLVYLDGDPVTDDLLTNGMAWWFRPFVPFERGYKHLEDNAREAKVGLWAYPDPIPPWKFHKLPIVDGRAQTDNWVHPWVRKDASDIGSSNSDAIMRETVTKPASPDPTAEGGTTPVESGTKEQLTEELSPQVLPNSQNISIKSPPASNENSDKRASTDPGSNVKPRFACHRMLKELKNIVGKREPISLAQVREILGSPYRECKKDTETVNCFECTVIGRKTENVEVIEKEGAVSDFHLRACRCLN